MDIKKVKEYLCINDIRNPDFNDIYREDPEDFLRPKNCSCDNCFYGRDILAQEILKLMGENSDER